MVATLVAAQIFAFILKQGLYLMLELGVVWLKLVYSFVITVQLC